ncbi:stage V sporulation protein AE [Alkalithermobacter thermoalcaliphilus JW-YL-7 = DSM 7308]|uniref:Stage V sporulation protein AE n=1 Tax=Alkalithermobacter thermoalcaliphilus JW-YL-7 = DSM 7308 TaxID=1121328 RepID=A0A150FP34_CLOPD|nr:stage V sporulation protein AE [[Clostridium] paradoxum JW-YL-7 = DSM 7308]SHK53503.1 stage V sporulation protein AE [[Clostridium] paradoxum JW-YL-7 = DSM 7308]
MEYIWAFVIGGLICLIGQILMDFFKIPVPYIMVAFVTSGVILTALGIYEPIVKIGGAGATVPLPGFGYSLAKGVMKEVSQKGLLGAFTGGTAATAGGITAAVFFGYLMSIIFNPKTKP